MITSLVTLPPIVEPLLVAELVTMMVMNLGTLAGAPVSPPAGVLVLSKHLMRAARYLVAGDVEITQTEPSVIAAGSGPALTAGQNLPASLFTAQRVTTAEITSPVSVTEQTTNLLENK